MRIKKKSNIFILVAAVFVVAAGFLTVDAYFKRPQKTEIITSDKTSVPVNGKITSKYSSGDGQKKQRHLEAPAKTTLSYESQPISLKGSPNAAIIEWGQSSDKGVAVEVRTHNGFKWTPWMPTDSVDGGKDGTKTDTKSSAFVLAKNINATQFRLTLTGKSSSSASVDLASTTVQSINSKKGPDGNESKPIYQSILDVASGESASAAINNGPKIISRADWGNPSPNYSEWEPTYSSLKRAVVHHTATTEPSDTYATVRAIWHYHAKSLGWGDIGYNYLVDYSGKIFEGRYYNHDHATKNRVDVVAGHAYNNNVGTTGISAIGTYSTIKPTDAMLNSISNIIAYKFAPYSLDPRGESGFGPGSGGAVIGHREVNATSCPGDAMYSRMQHIKNTAYHPYLSYNKQYLYDFQHVNTEILKDGSPIAHNTPLLPTDNSRVRVYLKNTGGSSWSNTHNPIVLGTSSPQNRSGHLHHSLWRAPNRLSSFTAKIDSAGGHTTSSTVHPGETGIFEFPISIPAITKTTDSAPITIKEYIQPVIDGVSWFPHDIGMHLSVNVQPVTYDYSIESQAIFADESLTNPVQSPLQPDTDYYLAIALKNTGTAQWRKNVLNLGTTSPSNRASVLANESWLSQNRLSSMNETIVNPGEIAHFTTKIRTPAPLDTAFTHREYVTPVADGITWLKDVGIYWNIEVLRAEYKWQIVSQNLYSDEGHTVEVSNQELTKGDRYYASLVVKNTGNTTWYKNSFNLGTTSPRNRESIFKSADWLSPNRAATIKEASVKPGETGTIEFSFNTNDNSKNAKEYFTPVVEHRTWLVDYGLYWRLDFK